MSAAADRLFDDYWFVLAGTGRARGPGGGDRERPAPPAKPTGAGPEVASVVPAEDRKHRSLSPAGERFVNAIAQRDLKAALDVLKPLSVMDAQVAALDAGMSIASAKNKAAFFADIQGQLLKAVRAATANPMPTAAPVPAKEPQARPAPHAPREACARER